MSSPFVEINQMLTKKWLKVLGISLFMLVLLPVVGMVGLFAMDSAFGLQVSDVANVRYRGADDVELMGYLALPEGEGTFPAVLMVHEWWGLNEEITHMADRLAEEGYIVLAMDTYRGQVTSQVPRAIFLRVTMPEAQIDQDMQSAYEYLISLPQVDAERIGGIGFCYGGGVILRHATQNPALRATINLYGTTIEDPQAFGALLGEGAGAVLGIFGSADTQIPLESVEAFKVALQEANIDHRLTVYEDMPHAFVKPDNIDDDGAPREAWLEILAFFELHLSETPTRESQ